jgi:hypothetical protein
VPVDGFWSITIYNGEGHMVANDAEAYSVNNVTAKPNPVFCAHQQARLLFKADGHNDAEFRAVSFSVLVPSQ